MNLFFSRLIKQTVRIMADVAVDLKGGHAPAAKVATNVDANVT